MKQSQKQILKLQSNIISGDGSPDPVLPMGGVRVHQLLPTADMMNRGSAPLSSARATYGSFLLPIRQLFRKKSAHKVKRSLCILGLGNPGKEYLNTRHNIGFWLADELARHASVRFRKRPFSPYLHARIPARRIFPQEPAEDLRYDELILVKPLTYMNRSGKVIPYLFRQFGKPMQFLVAVDNMDLKPGTMRMKKRGGTAGHNGLKSVVHYLDKGFWPLYMGIGRPDKEGAVIEHVLGTAEETEMEHYRHITRDLPEILFALFTSPVEQIIERINTYSYSEISAGV